MKTDATHCLHGHEMTPENTYVKPSGYHECRACRKARRRYEPRPREYPSLRQRLFDRTSIGGFATCWFWQGRLDGRGYGVIEINRRRVKAHRAVYEFLRGPIAAGLVLHHICEEARCVNPRHLVPVTNREHHEAHDFKGNRVSSANRRQRSQCPRGHPFDDENTLWVKDGARRCRTCDRERHERNRALAALADALEAE